MSEVKHTPLPWQSEWPDEEGDRYIASTVTTTCTETAVAKLREDQMEDASFIVMACNSHYDLLGALKLFVRAEKMARDGNPPQDADELIEIGESAIAKAEGRT